MARINHLKDCGIVSQLTPPRTPQWNGVFERRNKTLLDMVRSMKRYGFLVTDDKTIELVDQDEPTTYHEAMMSPDYEKWLQAIKSHM